MRLPRMIAATPLHVIREVIRQHYHLADIGLWDVLIAVRTISRALFTVRDSVDQDAVVSINATSTVGACFLMRRPRQVLLIAGPIVLPTVGSYDQPRIRVVIPANPLGPVQPWEAWTVLITYQR